MFDFGIDESWQAVRRALENVTGGTCDITVMRKMWEENKKQLFPLFDGTGRIVSSVDGTLVTEDMQREEAHQATMGSIDKVYGKGLLSFAQREHLIILARRVLSHVLPIEIAENKIHYNREDPRNPDKVLNGVKFGTYVRYLAQKEFDSDLLVDTIVTAFSCATATIKRKAYQVVISINPLDMLLASEHTTGWSSCHGLDDCKATGALAYLLDNTSAIAYAYARAERNTVAGVTLPVKLWRQMVFFDLSTFSALTSRQYPEEMVWCSQTVEYALGKMLAKLYGEGAVETVSVTCADNNGKYRYAPLGKWHHVDRLHNLVSISPTQRKAVVTPGVATLPCLTCPTERDDIQTNKWVCHHCGDYGTTCTDCGAFCSTDCDDSNAAEWVDGDPYCRSCWRRLFVPCHDCDDYVPVDSVTVVDGDNICEGCFDAYYAVCVNCSEPGLITDMSVADDGDMYCGACAADVFCRCGRCRKLFFSEDTDSSEGRTMCRQCVGIVKKRGA